MKNPLQGSAFNTTGQSILENCTERKSATCKCSSGKRLELVRAASCLFCNPKTSEYHKKLFSGLFYQGGVAQILRQMFQFLSRRL
jgi:hypothetical protein